MLKAFREKWYCTYWEIKMRITADFLSEIMQIRRKWDIHIEYSKKKKLSNRIFLPRKKKSLKIADEIRTFSDKQNLQEFCPSRPAGGMN